MMTVNEITEAIIGSSIEVHRELGPGLLESAYRQCLCHELTLRGMPFVCERPLPVVYKGLRLDCGYRVDLVVADAVVVELKTVDRLAPVHDAQLLTYLRLGGWKVGLLINFNVELLRNGISPARSRAGRVATVTAILNRRDAEAQRTSLFDRGWLNKSETIAGACCD